MRRFAGLLVWTLPLGLLVEGLGVAFEDEAFSVTAALVWAALFASVFALGEWADEQLKRPLTRFGVLALGFSLLLAVIAPLLRGDELDPIPQVLVAVGTAALFAALGYVVDRSEHRAKNHHRPA